MQVPPDRKLPAFYVLDSIAKNVGGAYTRCLSQNLYHTFMNAYASVQAPIRKKLDEMVKTWKEPVPGSTDTRPVFPVETTRPIETNLIKFRTLAFQAAQQPAEDSRACRCLIRLTHITQRHRPVGVGGILQHHLRATGTTRPQMHRPIHSRMAYPGALSDNHQANKLNLLPATSHILAITNFHLSSQHLRTFSRLINLQLPSPIHIRFHRYRT